MQPNEVRTSAQARAIVEERGLTHVKVGVFDNDGILRGKYIDRAKFLSALDKGMGFCDVVLGWDSNDQQYDNITFTGWHTAFPDAPVRAAARDLPCPALWRATCCCSSASLPATPKLCVRGPRCGACLQRAARMGYSASAAAEFEFFVFDETPASVREKNYQNLQEPDPGLLRLLHAAQRRAHRAVPGAAAAGR